MRSQMNLEGAGVGEGFLAKSKQIEMSNKKEKFVNMEFFWNLLANMTPIILLVNLSDMQL